MKKYFSENSEGDKRSELEQIYNQTEEIFDLREKESKCDKLEALEHKYQKVLKMDRGENLSADEKMKKLVYFVKGNLCLRIAQTLDEQFEDSNDYYKKAAGYLWHYTDIHSTNGQSSLDEMDCLLLMCKAKYYRSYAKQGQKFYYQTAKKLFEDVMEQAERVDFDFGRKTHLILDSFTNIARCQRYIYHLDESEEMFEALAKYLGDIHVPFNCERESILNSIKELMTKGNIHKYDSRLEQLGKDNTNDYVKDYLLQSLIHLGIIRRKRRHYEEAVKIFELVLELDAENVDAQNNIGVCNRKTQKVDEAVELFKRLPNNRFATINLFKCYLQLDDREFLKQEKVLESRLVSNPRDSDLRMLLGRYYERLGKYNEAAEIFGDLYEEFPTLREGTIGLKAYYNLAQCRIRLGYYHEAKEILGSILNNKKDDMLANIEYAWCLMQEGQYAEAEVIYEALVEKSTNIEPQYSTRIFNNLCECRIYLEKLQEAKEACGQTLLIQPDNANALYFRAYVSYLEKQDPKETFHYFTEAMVCDPMAMNIHSGWMITAVEYWQSLSGEDRQKQEQIILEDLKYSPAPLSLKSCIKLSSMIAQKIEGINEDEDGDKEEQVRWEYCCDRFCRILEMNHQESESFCLLVEHMSRYIPSSIKKAKLLTLLYELYGHIMAVKHRSRYIHKAGDALPVHYTKLPVLRLLMDHESARPRLRLWNIVSMNDSYEGGVFEKLLGGVIDSLYDGEDEREDKKRLLRKYLGDTPEMDSDSSATSKYKDSSARMPSESNIYLTSFSEASDCFQMWNIYADKQTGCALTFDEYFLEVKQAVSDPFHSIDASRTPLYKVFYVDKNLEIVNPEEDEKVRDFSVNLSQVLSDIWNCILRIDRWIDNYLSESVKVEAQAKRASMDAKQELVEEIRIFVSDHINEIRYLFKEDEYMYEKELRMVRCSRMPEIDRNDKFSVPRLYINVDKEIRNLEVRLGSKLSPQEIREISTWLYGTGKVNKVTVSDI